MARTQEEIDEIVAAAEALEPGWTQRDYDRLVAALNPVSPPTTAESLATYQAAEAAKQGTAAEKHDAGLAAVGAEYLRKASTRVKSHGQAAHRDLTRWADDVEAR